MTASVTELAFYLYHYPLLLYQLASPQLVEWYLCYLISTYQPANSE